MNKTATLCQSCRARLAHKDGNQQKSALKNSRDAPSAHQDGSCRYKNGEAVSGFPVRTRTQMRSVVGQWFLPRFIREGITQHAFNHRQVLMNKRAGVIRNAMRLTHLLYLLRHRRIMTCRNIRKQMMFNLTA